MALFLVQHGKNLSKTEDPKKGLSQEGKSDVKRIADTAKAYGVHVSQIRHSGKTRALETTEIFAAALKPSNGLQASIGINPLDDVTAVAETIHSQDDIMLVGHLPFMERLTSYLITGSIDTPVFKFQNGGIVCLEKDLDTLNWVIKWALMPKVG
jgi:phosphohistidine phosphatase